MKKIGLSLSVLVICLISLAACGNHKKEEVQLDKSSEVALKKEINDLKKANSSLEREVSSLKIGNINIDISEADLADLSPELRGKIQKRMLLLEDQKNVKNPQKQKEIAKEIDTLDDEIETGIAAIQETKKTKKSRFDNNYDSSKKIASNRKKTNKQNNQTPKEKTEDESKEVEKKPGVSKPALQMEPQENDNSQKINALNNQKAALVEEQQKAAAEEDYDRARQLKLQIEQIEQQVEQLESES